MNPVNAYVLFNPWCEQILFTLWIILYYKHRLDIFRPRKYIKGAASI